MSNSETRVDIPGDTPCTQLLYFIDGQMIWQCHHSLQSEDGHLFETGTGVASSDGVLSSTPLYDLKKLYQASVGVSVWWKLLKDFFKRESTKLEDTLPSLAGVIDVWQSCNNNSPRGRAVIQHAIWGNYADPRDVVWQADIEAVDIQWEKRPLVSGLEHAELSLYRVRATKGASHRAVFYYLDNEEKQFMKPEAVELIPLVITKPSSSALRGNARLHMHTLLAERIYSSDRQVKFRRKGYADFVSSSDCNSSEIDESVEDIISGIEVVDIIKMV
ncbi:hypothetical protein N0V90_009051 [Kalmusia sp. IMI 367209]|nr:hypothetical protein N0V90_009051 [Kalmusia sp. IMI 367209]